MYLIRPNVDFGDLAGPWPHLAVLASLLAVAGCPSAQPTQPKQPSDAPQAPSSARAPELAAKAPASVKIALPFDPEDDLLDIVGVWALTAKDAKPVAMSKKIRPWAVPVHGSLRVELWQRLTDFRVRLLDGDGRMLPHEVLVGQVPVHPQRKPVEPGGTWVQVTATDGFPPATPVQIVIDGENGPRALDIHGKGYQDLVLDVIGDTPTAPLDPGDAGEDAGTPPIGQENLP